MQKIVRSCRSFWFVARLPRVFGFLGRNTVKLKNKLNIIDMFCRGGGESTGLISAALEYNFDINMSAINHWKRAIETHSANYPFAEHRIEDVQTINPESLMASKDCTLLWASPGCQHFPKDTQKSALSPTQKPVALLEFLIKSYTNERATVLDSCYGSCSTGVACKNTDRNFIGIEKDSYFFEVGKKRLEEMTA